MAVIALAATGVSSAGAATVTAGLKVFPVKVNLAPAPGREARVDFTVVNTAKLPAEVAVDVQDFTRNDKGDYRFYDAGRRPRLVSTAAWTGLTPKKFLLAPSDAKKVTITVRPPKGVGPGGHFAMVFVTGTPVIEAGKAEQRMIIGKARLGVMLRATVKGRIVDKARLVEFGAPRVSFGRSVEFSLLFVNDGNIHKDIAGVITVKKGAAQVARIPIDEWTSLPGATLKIKTGWNDAGLGAYQATALVASRDGGKWTETNNFYVLPIKPLLWWLAALAAAMAAGRFLTGRYSFKVKKKDDKQA